MFPISDENPTLRTPVMTIALLAITWAVWIIVQRMGDPLALAVSVCEYGMVPGELTKQQPIGFAVFLGRIGDQALSCAIDAKPINLVTPILSIFLHGSWGHLLGNSLYLWVFGNNVEDSMGRFRFLAFYLITGLVAAGSHLLVEPSSPLPTVGASGAISGVMGAYLVLYPRVRVRTFVPPFFLLRFPAWAVLLLWFGSQVLTGLPQLSSLRPEIAGGVAVWAHIGGFVAGAVLIRVFRDRDFVRRRYIGADAQAVWS